MTAAVTRWIAHEGAYAVFILMAVDAVLPAAGELTMLYAGVLAGGAIAGAHASLFGVHLASGAEAYVVLSLVGVLGSLAGALLGWSIGALGGRPLIHRYGRRLHVGPHEMDSAERWFERYGEPAVLLARLTPVVRSFVAIPAGALDRPLAPYTLYTLIAALVWCFAFTAAGWALGTAWTAVHHAVGYAGYVVAAGAAVLLAIAVLHRRRRRAGAHDRPARG